MGQAQTETQTTGKIEAETEAETEKREEVEKEVIHRIAAVLVALGDLGESLHDLAEIDIL